MSKISVIVTTYNWPEALDATLTSLIGQTDRDFEIIVADDGSTEQTRHVIDRLRAASPVSVVHVWHPDEGFRAAAIRNRAIAAASGEYLVLMDGDCFVTADFVATHRALMQPGYFVSGKRSFLREAITQRCLAGRTPRHGRAGWLLRGLANQCTRPLQFLHLPFAGLRYSHETDWRKVQTCNIAVWKADADRINGFDERYQGHGLEDSDFILRLLRAGVKRKRGDYASIVLHLNHPRRTGGEGNVDLFRALESGTGYVAEKGLAEARQDAGA